MSKHINSLRTLALAGALSGFAMTGAGAADLVCNKCVDTSDIAKQAVSANRLKAGAVRTGKIADGAVTGTKILDGTVTGADLAPGAVGNGNLAADAVTGATIQDGTVGGADITGGAVGAGHLAADAVTGAAILDGSVDGADLATGAVGASEIATGAVGASEIATGAVGASEIADGSITGTDVADDSLPATELSNEAGASFTGLLADVSLTSAVQTVGTLVLTAPSSGVVIATASGTFESVSSTGSARCSLTRNSTTLDANDQFFSQRKPGDASYETFGMTQGFNVAAGSSTFRLVCDELADDVTVVNPHITAMFFPTQY